MKSILKKFGALLGITVVILVWDILLATNQLPDDTWSELLRDAALRHWWIPHAWGFLAAHIWWNGKRPSGVEQWMVWVWGFGSLFLDIVVAYFLMNGNVLPVWFNVVMFSVVGPIMGRLLWPQSRRISTRLP